jgi:hypothetical protein
VPPGYIDNPQSVGAVRLRQFKANRFMIEVEKNEVAIVFNIPPNALGG